MDAHHGVAEDDLDHGTVVLGDGARRRRAHPAHFHRCRCKHNRQNVVPACRQHLKQASTKFAPPFEYHVCVDPVRHRKLRNRYPGLTRSRSKPPLEFDRIVRPPFRLPGFISVSKVVPIIKVVGTTLAAGMPTSTYLATHLPDSPRRMTHPCCSISAMTGLAASTSRSPPPGRQSHAQGECMSHPYSTPDLAGSLMSTPRSRYGYTLCCGCLLLVFGPGAIPASPIVRMSRCTRLRLTICSSLLRCTTMRPAAVKRSACVFLVDQPAQQQIFLILLALDGPAIHACP